MSSTVPSSYMTRHAIPRRRSNQQPTVIAATAPAQSVVKTSIVLPFVTSSSSSTTTSTDVDIVNPTMMNNKNNSISGSNSGTGIISSGSNPRLPMQQRTQSSISSSYHGQSPQHQQQQPLLQRIHNPGVNGSNNCTGTITCSGSGSGNKHRKLSSLFNYFHHTTITTTTNNNNNHKNVSSSHLSLRRVGARSKWGWFRHVVGMNNHRWTDPDKYHHPPSHNNHHRRYKQSTSIVLLMIGLIFVAICSLLLVWNMYFNFYHAMDFTGTIRRGNKNATTTNRLRILPQPDHQEQDLSQPVHPIHDLAAKSSYKKKLTGLRADILTSNNNTVRDSIHDVGPTPKLTEWRNDENVVHVIQTRFMQNQPLLVALGQARLRLFTAVTVPSMRFQTQQQFLWIIRTDPQLHPSILVPLIETISLLPNAILVASNRNPEGFRDVSCISDVTTETLLVGSMEYLLSYYYAGQTHTVLETRCDADDAIAIDFVELIQKSATSGLYPLYDDWIVYCADNHMEWQYDNPWANEIEDVIPSSNSTITSHTEMDNPPDGNSHPKDRGALLVLRSGHCVTPGLTWGYSINATRQDIPVSQHNKIQKSVKPCGTRWHDTPPLQTKCLLKLGDDFPLALRARTPTSAGMDHVFLANQTENTFPMDLLQQSKARGLQSQLWNVLFKLFGINGEDLYQVRKYISEHFVSIARDALAGQCTKGHSCKNSSKLLLQKLINAADQYPHHQVNEASPDTHDVSESDERK